MMQLMLFLLFITQAVLMVPLLVLFGQVVSAYFARHRLHPQPLDAGTQTCGIAVIVPAHNEELGLASTLKSILPQLRPQDRLLVVADNCSDKTAVIASSMGAIVLERFNLEQRGKGYALDFAMQHLTSNPPDIVMIVDADCHVADNLLGSLASQCLHQQRPIQANYLMTFQNKETMSLKQQVTAFAWLVKNTVRPLGYRQLGLPCQLMGTGMAFLWKDLATCQLASGHLVEDMQLGIELAMMGKSPAFSMNTHVHSYFPNSIEGQFSQRTRWEHGHLSVIVQALPAILNKAIRAKNKQLFAQALDLSVPPLALLFTMLIMVAVLAIILWAITDSSIGVILSLIQLTILGISVMIAWNGFGRETIQFNQLLVAPAILLMKLPIYIGFLFRRQVDWVRSKRD